MTRRVLHRFFPAGTYSIGTISPVERLGVRVMPLEVQVTPPWVFPDAGVYPSGSVVVSMALDDIAAIYCRWWRADGAGFDWRRYTGPFTVSFTDDYSAQVEAYCIDPTKLPSNVVTRLYRKS